MPRPTRHRARFHRDRVIAKRAQQVRALMGSDYVREWLTDRSDGHHANELRYLGCRRPRCGLCHPSKRWHASADRM